MVTEKISPHFTLDMLTRSETAKRKGIPNIPGPIELERLRALSETILEPLYRRYGSKVVVTSAYRSKALNDAIGGSKTSQHMKGEAADLVVAGVSNLEVAKWLSRNVKYGQVIHEFGEWVHVSLPYPKGPQLLTCYRKGGKVVYESGLKEIP